MLFPGVENDCLAANTSGLTGPKLTLQAGELMHDLAFQRMAAVANNEFASHRHVAHRASLGREYKVAQQPLGTGAGDAWGVQRDGKEIGWACHSENAPWRADTGSAAFGGAGKELIRRQQGALQLYHPEMIFQLTC